MEQTPTNAQIADVFERIAEILEGQGENPFKIRAYRNAVRTLETLPEPAAAIEARGELKKIPGFGEAIVGKTREILATGTCELYERLQAEEAAKAEAAPAPDPAPAAEGPSLDDEDIEAPW